MIDGVRTVTDPDGTTWYVLRDLAEVICVRDAGSLVRNLPYGATETRVIPTKGGAQRVRVVSGESLRIILSKSRKPEAVALSEKLGWYSTRPYVDESDTLHAIQTALKHLKPVTQKSCGNYKIDMYFPEIRVAVECDEHGHSSRDPAYEAMRQEFIEDQLQCTFVRYNPNSSGFNIFKVINQILTSVRDSGSM